jgi:hypothetical protein
MTGTISGLSAKAGMPATRRPADKATNMKVATRRAAVLLFGFIKNTSRLNITAFGLLASDRSKIIIYRILVFIRFPGLKNKKNPAHGPSG